MGQNLRDKKVIQKIPCYVGYVFQNPDNQIFMRKVYDEVAYGLKNLKFRSRKSTKESTRH